MTLNDIDVLEGHQYESIDAVALKRRLRWRGYLVKMAVENFPNSFLFMEK